MTVLNQYFVTTYVLNDQLPVQVMLCSVMQWVSVEYLHSKHLKAQDLLDCSSHLVLYKFKGMTLTPILFMVIT